MCMSVKFEKGNTVCNIYFRGKTRCVLGTLAQVRQKEYRMQML